MKKCNMCTHRDPASDYCKKKKKACKTIRRCKDYKQDDIDPMWYMGIKGGRM